MSDIFSDTEIQESPESYNDDDYSSESYDDDDDDDDDNYSKESYNDGNCPPGHYISIAHGGKGHWDGDGCCNSSPTASISFIIPFLMITAILMVVFSTKKLKEDDKSF